jgi:predicted CxxxxCH...CXXCH cytochrome family protein
VVSAGPEGPITTGAHVNGAVDLTRRIHPPGWADRTAHGAAARADAASCATAGCHGPALLDPSSALSCAACHGGEGGCATCHAAPPATGAHQRHYLESGEQLRAAYGDLRILADYAPQGAPEYQFGCGHCHPIDPARHLNGAIDVDLSPAGAQAGTLKARNAASAAYTGTPGAAPGTCSGVYCHSSGQQAPSYVVTPAWNAPGPIACNGCHENPPRYPSGGAGSATANSHVQVGANEPLQPPFVWGHFGGVGSHPAVFALGNQSRHGLYGSVNCAPGSCPNAAPITCETCHAGTVARRPGESYYLDTTSDFTIGGVDDAARRCSDCHGVRPGAGVTTRGSVQPLLHVNGQRDIVFDAATAAPAPFTDYSPVPPAGGQPSLRYWTTGWPVVFRPLGDFAIDGPVVSGNATISLHLGNAAYEARTKTCSNVGCHVQQTQVQWGTPYATQAGTCNVCHPNARPLPAQ